MAITGADICNTANKYLGIKYFEGNPQSRANGYDCSGFVQAIMHDLGVSIPRTTALQLAAAANKNVGTNLNNAVQGDVLHYVGHEEIWVGAGMVLSEATSGTYSSLRTRTPWPIIGIIRYADGGPGPAVSDFAQTVPGKPVTDPSAKNIHSLDPGKVSGQLVDVVPGAHAIVDPIAAIGAFLTSAGNPGFWSRVGLGILGAALLILGLYGMIHKANVVTVATNTIGKAVPNAS